MNKTGDEIELDVFNIITNSQLAKEIKGNVYREGTRDLNPMEEDIIVSFLTGLDGQFQTGSVTLKMLADAVIWHAKPMRLLDP